jgi:hypothetical protein
MNDEIIGTKDESIEAIIIKRQKMEMEAKPDLAARSSVILKNGPRSFKVATHWVLKNRHTNEVHHQAVKIQTFSKNAAGWTLDKPHSVTVDDLKGDEIRALAVFLNSILGQNIPEETEEYLAISTIKNYENKAELISQVLTLAEDPMALNLLIENAKNNPEKSKGIAAALNIARYTEAVTGLERLIENNAGEGAFQKHFSENPWMFGSEYSELLDQRKFTRNEEQDFMLRRTVDGYLEAIEIKTALVDMPLFFKDSSHNTLYPRSELSLVVGQVLKYIEELDAFRHSILAKDAEDVCKIRAKIIIGRDNNKEQITALRRYNGHLHRIEILTFDQLLRIAQQVVNSMHNIIELN